MKTARAWLIDHIGSIISIAWMYKNLDAKTFRENVREHLRVWLKAHFSKRMYNVKSYEDLLAHKKSQRAFIFGSGYSINSITDEEWDHIGKFDTIGFNGSIYLDKIPQKFLVFRAWTEIAAGLVNWRNDTFEVLNVIKKNQKLDETIFLFPNNISSVFNNRIIADKLWDKKNALYFYYTDKLSKLPHADMRNGLVHATGSLCSAISLAVGLGYKEIVLAGVDLYDNRYFWLPYEKTLSWSETEQKAVPGDVNPRGLAVNSVHNTVNNGIIELIKEWNLAFKEQFGISMYIYNPKSLLSEVLPVYDRGKNAGS